MNISLNCDIENNRIKLRFVNNDNNTVSLFTPCPTNTFIYIRNKNFELVPNLLLRRYCDAKSFCIRGKESKDFFSPYDLNELFELEKGQEYEIKIEYYVYEKGKVKRKFQTACIFIW